MKKDLLKRIISLIYFCSIAVMLLIPVFMTHAQGYQLLAPLPCPPNSSTGCTADGSLETVDPGMGLGAYLNMMITIFIGLCAVLSVVMIVIGGIEYMTSELPGNKEHGKERITNAVFGLVLALGSYALLYTINPDLLNTKINLPNATVTVQLQDEREVIGNTVPKDSGPIPSGAVAGCPEGVSNTKSGIVACKNGKMDIDKMIADAKTAGLDISGGGFRTLGQQTALRKQNCSGNTTDRNAKCDPLTALPGNSRHESGLAFDLTCSGATIKASDNKCFLWLKSNAAKYGLHNLPAEQWHWSIDGR